MNAQANTVTGEAINIESARKTLRAIAARAEKAASAIDKLSASLTDAAIDATDLEAVAAIHEASDRLEATANRPLSGLSRRHEAIEEAVNSSSRTASTGFYRH